MLVMCIIGILAAIAYPSYQHQLYKTRRSEGQQQLLLLASEVEMLYSSKKNNQPARHNISEISTIKSPYYHLNITFLSDNAYTLTATPKLDAAQANDPCGILFINEKQITGPRAECWE